MGETYFRMGKVDEAIQKFKEALEVKPDFGSDWKISYLYALKKEYGEAMRWLDQFIAMASTESLRAQGHLWKGFYYNLQGKLGQALQEIDEAMDLAEKANNMRMVDVAYRSKIWTCYDWGKLDLFQRYVQERHDFRAAREYRPVEENELFYAFYMGMLDARRGQTASARNRLAEVQAIHAQMPGDLKDDNNIAEKYILSHVLLAEGSVDDAVTVFKEIPSTPLSFSDFYAYIYKNLPYRADFGARGFQIKGDVDQAIIAYEKLTTFDPTQAAFEPLIHPFSHLQLAKLYEEKGMREKAREQYELALSYWQEADDGLVPVMQAREGLHRLF
jgi:tetratricopeptide (TPR) repeat protein